MITSNLRPDSPHLPLRHPASRYAALAMTLIGIWLAPNMAAHMLPGAADHRHHHEAGSTLTRQRNGWRLMARWWAVPRP